MKLVPGQTIIGRAFLIDDSTGMIDDYTVYYGNALQPVVNNQIMHLEPNDYKTMLTAFLDEDTDVDEKFIIEPGGSQYDIPTEIEVKQATVEMLNREKAILNQMKKENGEQADETSEETGDISDTNEDSDISNVDTEQSKAVPPISKDLATQLEELSIQLGIVQDKRVKTSRIISIVTSLLAVIALALAGYMYYRQTTITPPDAVKISINGKSYLTPIAKIDVQPGEEKILIYGFITTNENGEITHKGVPLGEFDLAKKQEEPEEQVEEANSDEQSDEQTENADTASEEQGADSQPD